MLRFGTEFLEIEEEDVLGESETGVVSISREVKEALDETEYAEFRGQVIKTRGSLPPGGRVLHVDVCRTPS